MVLVARGAINFKARLGTFFDFVRRLSLACVNEAGALRYFEGTKVLRRVRIFQ